MNASEPEYKPLAYCNGYDGQAHEFKHVEHKEFDDKSHYDLYQCIHCPHHRYLHGDRIYEDMETE